ncbi:MAG: S9 family peptidase [Hyphomonadaceae bacterium]|nr:S9 family peptidase [Hyphomonadaceae bacterium]
MFLRCAAAAWLLCLTGAAFAQSAPSTTFTAADVFNLEYADNPQISSDGRRVAYERVSADIMTDRFRRSIWMVDESGRNHRPVAQGAGAYASPVWSPDGRAIAFYAQDNGASELRVFYLDTQRAATIARLRGGVSNLTWSPDGRTLAFQMFTPEAGSAAVGLPARPDGAQWAEPPRVIDSVIYQFDGVGYVPSGHTQIYVAPIDGGTPRQLTFDARDHDGRMSWTPDGQRLVFSANAQDGHDFNPIESDVYALDIEDGAITRLTNRIGPEAQPAISADGRRLAYVGFDDREQGYQVSELYVANADGSSPRSLTASFDRDVRAPQWVGGSIYFLTEDRGVTQLARISANGGRVEILLRNVGGTDIGRPYTSGAFTVNRTGRYAATITTPQRPADLVIGSGRSARQITALNEDVLGGKTLPTAERIVARSSADGRPIDAWIVRPPNFDPNRRYPMVLEIHGGPFAAYGPVFSAEVQLYAAAGYIVVYANPRGSTSYGGAFGNAIHHAYPGRDYDDLMSVVDAAMLAAPIDPQRLYVTGGSGGGVLTAWIVGTTDRFAAAMVQKPVINWTSFALTADIYTMVARYWFGELPWEEGAQERYWARSPLSRVGNVRTPTAVMVGEEDRRTPSSEAEQYFQALRLRHIPTRLILIPGSPHDIAARPTGMISKVTNTIAWFNEHGGPAVPPPNGAAGVR